MLIADPTPRIHLVKNKVRKDELNQFIQSIAQDTFMVIFYFDVYTTNSGGLDHSSPFAN